MCALTLMVLYHLEIYAAPWWLWVWAVLWDLSTASNVD